MLLIALPAVALLMLSHTRTAVLGLLIGLAIAGISLFPTSGRARRFVSVAGLLCAFAAIALGSVLQTWFQRGQSDGDFSNLTGRQKVWDALVATPRSGEQRLLGIGLTDKSFGGLPIDSSWLAVYHEQGLVGLTLVGLGLLVLVVTAVLRPPSAGRSCALFLIAYCLTSSYTECGLGDASPYILHLTLAAALLSGQRTAADHSPGQPLPAARRTPRWTKGATA